MKKIRLGIIGCGDRANVHLNGLIQMDNVEIAAVADPIEERRINAAKKTGATRIYRDHTDMYNHESRESIDAVMIFIEPTAHTDTETRAIDMGLHFFVEKPMTLDLKLADTVWKKSEEKGIITSVGFQDRYLDLIEIIKNELPKHTPGGLVYGAWVGTIPSVWWWQKKSTCGGQLVEQNIHLLDGLRYLYGEPLSIYATSCRGIVRPGVDASPEYDTDDHSTAVICFENNVTATLVSGCYSKTVRPNCGYVIVLDDMILDYRLRNNLIITTPTVTKDIRRNMDQTYALDQAFVQAVLTGNRSYVRSPYGDALKTLKLALAANKSMETGEVIYFK